MAEGGYGQQDPDTNASDYAARQFQIDQTLSQVRTIVLVKVMATTANGSVAAPGTVNVQPLTNMLDGQGNSTQHGTINNIPILRIGGGSGGLISDPVVGDIGVMAVCDRDISAVKTSKAAAAPGSLRQFDMADGIYLGSVLSGVPAQFIQITQALLNLVFSSTVKIAMSADGVVITFGGVSITLDSSNKVSIVASAGLWVNGVMVTVP